MCDTPTLLGSTRSGVGVPVSDVAEVSPEPGAVVAGYEGRGTRGSRWTGPPERPGGAELSYGLSPRGSDPPSHRPLGSPWRRGRRAAGRTGRRSSRTRPASARGFCRATRSTPLWSLTEPLRPSSTRPRSAHAGLLVLGHRGRGALGSTLGSVSVSVAEHARCPVVVVRGAVETSPSGPRAVTVGVDGTPESSLALDFAAETAARWGLGVGR